MKTTMIKSALILALLASGGAITLAAGNKSSFGNEPALLKNFENESDYDKKPQNIYEWIQNTMPCPEFINPEDDNRVELWLSISEKGRITVIDTKAQSDRLSDYVIEELNGKECLEVTQGNTYHFAINFRRIS